MIRKIYSFNSASETELSEDFSIVLSFTGKGFIFFKVKTNSKTVISIDEFHFDQPIHDLKELQGEFTAFTTDFLRNFENYPLTVFCNAESYTIIPDELFDSSKVPDYFAFLGIQHDTKHSYTTETVFLKDSLSKLLIVPLNWQIQFAQSALTNFNILFDIGIFVNSIMKRNDSPDAAYIHVSESFYELVLLKDNIPLIINRFPFSTAKDFCYYIIGSLNLNGLDPYSTPLFVSGEILPGSEIIQLLNRYVDNIRWLAPANIPIPANLPVHRYFIQLSV